MVGLLDPEQLYDGQRSGSENQRSAPGRGVVGVPSAPGRTGETAPNPSNGSAFSESTPQTTENANTGTKISPHPTVTQPPRPPALFLL